MEFTICLANGCVSFLVHALLPAMLLPVRQRGGRAYIFGGRGAGHTLDCRVWQPDHTKTYRITFIWYKTRMFFKLNICTDEGPLLTDTLSVVR